MINDGPGGTGGDCTTIGGWDEASRSCTLTMDVFDSVALFSAGLTLDCADPSTGKLHSIAGLPNDIGIFALANEAVVRNCDVSGFLVGFAALGSARYRIEYCVIHDNIFAGLHFINSGGSQVLSNDIRDSRTGIHVLFSADVSITSNVFLRNRSSRAIRLANSTGGLIAENTFIDNGFGITLFSGGKHEIRHNHFTGNGFPEVLPAGIGPRLAITGEGSNDHKLSGNVMNGNAYGFGLVGTEVTRNDIYDNAVTGLDSDGNPISEVKSLVASALNPDAIELSVGGIGNYWGRNCGGGLDGAPLFQPGIDSNDASVTDSHPFKHRVAATPPLGPPPKPMDCPP